MNCRRNKMERILSFLWPVIFRFSLRSSEGHQRWGQRSLTSLRSVNRSLDVGLPSPPLGGRRREASGVGGALFRLTGRPACRAFLLTSVVMMMVLLTGIIIFLITYKNKSATWHGRRPQQNLLLFLRLKKGHNQLNCKTASSQWVRESESSLLATCFTSRVKRW